MHRNNYFIGLIMWINNVYRTHSALHTLSKQSMLAVMTGAFIELLRSQFQYCMGKILNGKFLFYMNNPPCLRVCCIKEIDSTIFWQGLKTGKLIYIIVTLMQKRLNFIYKCIEIQYYENTVFIWYVNCILLACAYWFLVNCGLNSK